MDRKILSGLKKVLLFEAFFTGASSLSKVLGETEDELEDMIEYVNKNVQLQKLRDSKLFKGGKHK